MAIAVGTKVPLLRVFHEKIYDRCQGHVQAAPAITMMLHVIIRNDALEV